MEKHRAIPKGYMTVGEVFVEIRDNLHIRLYLP